MGDPEEALLYLSENSTDRGSRLAMIHRVTKSQRTVLSLHTHSKTFVCRLAHLSWLGWVGWQMCFLWGLMVKKGGLTAVASASYLIDREGK